MSINLELKPSPADGRMGQKSRLRVLALVIVVIGAVVAVTAWNNGMMPTTPTALKVATPDASLEEWKQCTARLSKKADECLTSNFPIAKSAKLYTVDSKTGRQSKEKLSARAVQRALPKFSCTTQHKVSMVGEKTIGFAYSDNTIATVDLDSCQVTGVYAPREDGRLHPAAFAMIQKSSGVWKANPICQSVGDDEDKTSALEVAAACQGDNNICAWSSQCCSNNCHNFVCMPRVIDVPPGGACLIGGQCRGFDWDKPNTYQCCYKKCEYNYPYPGQTSGVCGPRTTSLIVSDYGAKKVMDVTTWTYGTKVVMWPNYGGNQRWLIYHTPRWRVVQSATNSDRVWAMNGKNLEIRTFIKNDCNQLFKLEHRGGGKYVIKNKCQEHCLDLGHDNNLAPVLSHPCHYHTAQLWTLQ